ncbi:MAG: hypothetical protein HYZ28_13465 [Myxococcales bacterium]|nr:hypothetical protein [Myxococcales bacterium]
MAATSRLPKDKFTRLRLAKDLGVHGEALCDEMRPDAEAVQGMVLLAMALEIAISVALDAKRLHRSGRYFRNLIGDLPELASLMAQLEDFGEIRNNAQHRGIPPPPEIRSGRRLVAMEALRITFGAAGSNYDRLSSVEQVRTGIFRDALERAVSIAGSRPADAAALASLALRRIRGWAAQMTGEAVLPKEMWVFGTPLWEDLRMSVACLDNRQEFIEAMLMIAGGQALGLSMASQLRLEILGRGHSVSNQLEGPEFLHAGDAHPVAVEEAEWMIEAVARVAVKLEDEWPGFLIEDGEAKKEVDANDSPRAP